MNDNAARPRELPDIVRSCRPDELARLSPLVAGKRVCIIANGESVLKTEYGHLIDSFDVVVRMNQFAIRGYEKFVGSRTDLHAFTNQASYFDPELCQLVERFYCSDGFLLAPYLHPRYTEETLHFWTRRTGEWKTFLGNNWPTTGLRILIDVNDCEPALIWLLGYDFYENNSQYYYGPLRPGAPLIRSRHNPSAEKAYVLDLMSRRRNIVRGEDMGKRLAGR